MIADVFLHLIIQNDYEYRLLYDTILYYYISGVFSYDSLY